MNKISILLTLFLLPICANAQHVLPVPGNSELKHVVRIDTMLSSSAVLFHMPGGTAVVRMTAIVDSDLVDISSATIRTNVAGATVTYLEIGTMRGAEATAADWRYFSNPYDIELVYAGAGTPVGQIRIFLEYRDRR